MRTSRKVELLAAAFYAGSFILWTLDEDPESSGFMSAEELTDLVRGMRSVPTFSNWEVYSLALLVVAVGLTFAAVRLRKSSPQD